MMRTIFWTTVLLLTSLAPGLAQSTIVVNPGQTKLQWSIDVAPANSAATSYELSTVKTGQTAVYKAVTTATRTGEVWQMPFPTDLTDGSYLFLLRGVNTFGRSGVAELSVTIQRGTVPGTPSGFTVIVIATPPPEE